MSFNIVNIRFIYNYSIINKYTLYEYYKNMGNELSSCCNNTFVIKSDKELSLKKEKRIITDNQIDITDITNEVLKKKKMNDFEAISKKINSNQGSQIQTGNDNQNQNSYSFSFNHNQNKQLKSNLLEPFLNKTPVLFIKILNQSDSLLEKGQILKINCVGLIESQSFRNGNDGITYFGIIKSDYIEKGNEVDVVLKNENEEVDNEKGSSVGRHFKIEFNIEKSGFFLQDLGNSHGTFMKIEKKIALKDNFLLSIGESYIVINIFNKQYDDMSVSNNDISYSLKPNHLKLKVFGANETTKNFYFPPSNMIISIGRFSLADILIEDNLLSKIHCSITYSENQGWIFSDGHDGKPSTNGCWLFLNEEAEVYDGMIFKHNQTLFKVGMIN